MVSVLCDVLELKKVLPKRRNFLFLVEFLYLCGCATPLGSGERGVCLLSAGDPSANSGITLRLLLRVTPMGSGADTACRF